MKPTVIRMVEKLSPIYGVDQYIFSIEFPYCDRSFSHGSLEDARFHAKVLGATLVWDCEE